MTDGLPIPLACVLPAVLLLLGRLDVIGPRLALWGGVVVALLQLVGLGVFVGLAVPTRHVEPVGVRGDDGGVRRDRGRGQVSRSGTSRNQGADPGKGRCPSWAATPTSTLVNVRQPGGKMFDHRGRAAAPRRRRASTLLRAKVRAPERPEHFVRRARLHELLDTVVTCPLTVVVAPAGSGKTMLLAAWVAESVIPSAWLSLDDADRDATPLWSAVIGALETLAPGTGARAEALLLASGPLTDVVGQLLNDLETHDGTPGVLVVDDVHLVDDVDAVTRIAGPLPAAPAGVVARDPAVPPRPQPSHRPAAREGHLGEVRFAELRFSPSEASEMLFRLAPALSTEQINATAVMSKGGRQGCSWPRWRRGDAGPATDRDPPRRSGTCWSTTTCGARCSPPRTRTWSRRWWRSPSSTGSTAASRTPLTERPDADQLLLRAEARGLFVTRLGVKGWFAVHSLVRAPSSPSWPGRHRPIAEQHARAAPLAAGCRRGAGCARALAARRAARAMPCACSLARHDRAVRQRSRGDDPAHDRGDPRRRGHRRPRRRCSSTRWCHLLVSRRRFSRQWSRPSGGRTARRWTTRSGCAC